MKLSLFVLLLSLAYCPSYCLAWTAGEWLGVIEATAGAVFLRPLHLSVIRAVIVTEQEG